MSYARRVSRTEQFRDLLTKAAPDVAQRLIELCNDPDPKVRKEAIELYCNRYMGKPEQPLTGADGGPIQLGAVILPVEDMLQADEVVQRLLHASDDPEPSSLSAEEQEQADEDAAATADADTLFRDREHEGSSTASMMRTVKRRKDDGQSSAK